jgi:hypothetical protein
VPREQTVVFPLPGGPVISRTCGSPFSLTKVQRFRIDNDSAGCFDWRALRRRIDAIQPCALAFNGKTAAAVFFGKPPVTIAYGRQYESIGETMIYVLPNALRAAARILFT